MAGGFEFSQDLVDKAVADLKAASTQIVETTRNWLATPTTSFECDPYKHLAQTLFGNSSRGQERNARGYTFADLTAIEA